MRALTDPVPHLDAEVEVDAWAASGAMALTGRADGDPLGPPSGLVSRLAAVGRELRDTARALGGQVDIEPLALLGERAAIAGLHRRGTTSVGGATRLLRTEDEEWLAVSLARPDDVALVPAWLEVDAAGDPWALIATVARERRAAALVERARLVGLPVARLGEATGQRPPTLSHSRGAIDPVRSLPGITVVELASLWAGPLCGSLLHAAGATVIKLESTARPDGARRGPPAFFDLLNAGKRSVAIDLQADAAYLATVIGSADVVIEGSRPRALEQLGIDVESMLQDGGPRVWLSITGHGREGTGRDRVAFGDDAAVAGGLVARDDDGPVFCADALADPLAGVVSAGAVLEALALGERRLIDVSLSAVAAAFAGPTLPVPRGVVGAHPTARAPSGPGPSLEPAREV